jgi:hypothetical protein
MVGWESDSCLECVAPRADLCRSFLLRVRQAGIERNRERHTKWWDSQEGERRDVEKEYEKKKTTERKSEKVQRRKH